MAGTRLEVMDVLHIKVSTGLGTTVELGCYGSATISGLNSYDQVCLDIAIDCRMIKRMTRKASKKTNPRRRSPPENI